MLMQWITFDLEPDIKRIVVEYENEEKHEEEHYKNLDDEYNDQGDFGLKKTSSCDSLNKPFDDKQ